MIHKEKYRERNNKDGVLYEAATSESSLDSSVALAEWAGVDNCSMDSNTGRLTLKMARTHSPNGPVLGNLECGPGSVLVKNLKDNTLNVMSVECFIDQYDVAGGVAKPGNADRLEGMIRMPQMWKHKDDKTLYDTRTYDGRNETEMLWWSGAGKASGDNDEIVLYGLPLQRFGTITVKTGEVLMKNISDGVFSVVDRSTLESRFQKVDMSADDIRMETARTDYLKTKDEGDAPLMETVEGGGNMNIVKFELPSSNLTFEKTGDGRWTVCPTQKDKTRPVDPAKLVKELEKACEAICGRMR